MEHVFQGRKTNYGPYSNSRLNVGNCGYSFYKQYGPEKNKHGQSSSVASDRGAAAHEVLEKITRALHRDETFHISKSLVAEWIVEAVAKYPQAYSESGEILRMCMAYAANPPRLCSEAKTEIKIAMKFRDGKLDDCSYDDPTALIRGRIDILDRTDDASIWTIYDHKTQPNIETADTLQMGIYAWMVKRSFPYIKEVRTVLHFARYDRYSPIYVWTDEDINAIESEVLMRIAILESQQQWQATPHVGCQYCPLIASCPVLREHIDIGKDGHWHVQPHSLKILGSSGKAVQLAGLSHVLDELRGIVGDELREFVKLAEAPVAIPGKVYGYHVSEKKTDWKLVNKSMKKEIMKIFKDHRVDPIDYMGFSQEISSQVWRLSNEQLMAKLSEKLPFKSETRFEGKRR